METKTTKQQKTKALNIADVSSSATRTIRTQQGFSQHELTLPEDDAIMYMLILKRNKIWFADVTRLHLQDTDWYAGLMAFLWSGNMFWFNDYLKWFKNVA